MDDRLLAENNEDASSCEVRIRATQTERHGISFASTDETVNSSAFLSPMNSPDLPGPSSHVTVRPPADSSRIARCLWILTRIFPEVSQIFLHTLLESRDFDLLATLETLVNMAQHGNFVSYPGIIPSIRFYPVAPDKQPWNDDAAAHALMSLSSQQNINSSK
ncbi:hypothetical protein ACROYT_G002807 [Oculina patagonica]